MKSKCGFIANVKLVQELTAITWHKTFLSLNTLEWFCEETRIASFLLLSINFSQYNKDIQNIRNIKLCHKNNYDSQINDLGLGKVVSQYILAIPRSEKNLGHVKREIIL